MDILGINESLSAITEKLDKGLNLYYTRFGDNDIMQMSGTDLKGKSLTGRALGGNQTKFSKQLQLELHESFSIFDDSYMIGLSGDYPCEEGMTDGIFKPFPYKAPLEHKVKFLTIKRSFFNPVLFQYLFVFKPQIFQSFVDEYIKGGKTLFIGTVEREYVELLLGEVDYVRTPSQNAYDRIQEWWPAVLKLLSENDYDTIIPNCGQATRVIQKRMWNMNVNALSLDLGSIFDSIAGNPTRTWIRKTHNQIQKRYDIG